MNETGSEPACASSTARGGAAWVGQASNSARNSAASKFLSMAEVS